MDQDEEFGFAPDYDAPIPYMKRTRDYYLTLGYGNPYRWAHYLDVPFTKLTKPLSECRVGLITTAAPYDPSKGDQGPGAPYNSAAKFYTVYSGDTSQEHDLRISHIGYDRVHTKAEDSRAWFPLQAMRDAAASGRIGSFAPRFHGAPTNRSHRTTIDQDLPELLKRCREDQVDAMVLVPNCPVCHQTVSMAARYLEENGIPTVVMACARDIVEHCGVPRFLFTDFPLGNPCGHPWDREMQAEILRLALRLLDAASAPRTTWRAPFDWKPDDPDWRDRYNRVRPEDRARLRALGDARRRARGQPSV